MRHLFILGSLFLSLTAQAKDLEALFAELEHYGAPDRAPASTALAPINWAQPQVGCVEELMPGPGSRPCLDLSEVDDPLKDFPDFISDAERAYWERNKRPLLYCRSLEVLKREKASPGSFTPGQVEVAWMQASAGGNREQKMNALYEASRNHRMPVQVLMGAIYQESLFAELGIAEDGENYSCGLGQINLEEWCRWATSQGAEVRQKLKLGPGDMNCRELDKTLVRPFYEIAKRRLNGLPEYRMTKEHFKNIKLENVINDFPDAPMPTQRARFQAVTAFINTCQDPKNAIAAKANELSSLYERFIPAGMKQKDQYAPGEKFQRKCKGEGYLGTYPLNSGWLLAVGSYNAGPRAVDAVAHYNRWSAADMEQLSTFKNFTPVTMVESVYWSGRYNPNTDKIEVTNRNGSISGWVWFKECVLQRHMARVAQHVTLPGTPTYIDSLEGDYKCAKSQFDEDGKLVKSAVPPFRQKSSGQKKIR